MYTRIAPIDGLRGLAILLVVLHHSFDPVYGYGRALDAIFAALSLGWVGVDLFFTISGFLITGILLETKQSPRYFLNFYARRFLRIFPLYYLFCFLALYVVPCLPFADPATFESIKAQQAWLWLYGANILVSIRHSWMLVTNCLELNHLWSLAVEEHFYLIWPLVVWVGSARQLKAICLSTISIVLVTRVTYVLCTHDSISAYVMTPFRIDALLLGALVALLSRELSPEKFKALGLTSLVVTFVLLTASFRFFDWRLGGTFAPAVGLSLLPLFFAALITCVVNSGNKNIVTRILSSQILSFFGKYSYGLYIYHFPVLKLLGAIGLVAYFIDATHSRLGGIMVFNFIALITAIFTSVISWQCWEKHFLKLKAHFISMEIS